MASVGDSPSIDVQLVSPANASVITATDDSTGIQRVILVVDDCILVKDIEWTFGTKKCLEYEFMEGDLKGKRGIFQYVFCFQKGTLWFSLDPTGTLLTRPLNGWGQKTYHIVPKLDVESLSSDFTKDLTIADNLAISVANRCSKYLFYSKLVGFNENKPVYDPGENNKFLFTVFSKTCAATAKHCLRAVQNDSQYRDAKIGDTFEITACADPQKSLLVKVKYFSSRLDFAIVEVVSENFTSYPAIDTPERGRRGVCLGLPYFEAVDGGNIVETQAKEREPVPFSVEIAALDVPVAGMFAGSCGLTHGYSGAGLFRIYGNTDLLMGICCRGRIPPEDWVSTWSRSNWLHRRSLAYYISSAIINFAIEEQEEPVIKKSKPSDVEKPTE